MKRWIVLMVFVLLSAVAAAVVLWKVFFAEETYDQLAARGCELCGKSWDALNQNDYDLVEQLAGQLLDLCGKLPENDKNRHEMAFTAYGHLGFVHFYKSYRRSIYWIDKALEQFAASSEASEPFTNLAYELMLFEVHILAEGLDDIERGELRLKQAEKIFFKLKKEYDSKAQDSEWVPYKQKDVNLLWRVCEFYGSAGGVYKAKKKWNEALRCFLQQKECVDRLSPDNLLELGLVHRNLCVIYAALKQWDECEKNAMEAWKCFRQKDRFNIKTYLELMRALAKQGKYTEALQVSESSLEWFCRRRLSAEDRREVAKIYYCMSRLYEKKDNRTKSEECRKAAVRRLGLPALQNTCDLGFL